MKRWSRRLGRWLGGRRGADERGFTLAESLVAIALLTIAVVGVGGALAVQSGGLARGTAVGLAAVSRANYVGTATLLAQERLEQVKNAQYTATPNIDQITAANFPNEAYGAIAGYTNFRRSVTIQTGVPAAATKTVTVQVFYRPPVESGLAQEESVQLTTIVARRLSP